MFGFKERRAKSIQTRVSRGVALLDEHKPGWHRHINLDRLDISDGRHCALGQTYGLYGWGCDRLGLSRRTTASHGVQVDYRAVPIIGVQSEYTRLTEEWKRQIEERLDEERKAWANDPKVMRGHRLFGSRR